MAPPSQKIENAAAEWLGLRDGGLTAAQQIELSAWLRADPRHRDAFARLDSASRSLDRLAAFRPVNGGAPDPDLPLGSRARQTRIRRPARMAWFPSILATAAAFAIGYFGWWVPARETAPFADVASTAIGVMQTLPLPDGSVVNINTDSAIVVEFTATERRIQLTRGEAHFTVAKNPGRPFVVSAGGTAVRAVGTAFNVRLRRESVEVLVTEGTVRLAPVEEVAPGPEAREQTPLRDLRVPTAELTAGRHVVIPLQGGGAESVRARPVAATVAPAEISRLLAWQERRIEFDPTPLSVVAEEFNRYNRQKLVVADAATAALRVGGSFRADDSETFVRLLESSFGVVVERRGDETILRYTPRE